MASSEKSSGSPPALALSLTVLTSREVRSPVSVAGHFLPPDTI